MPRTTRCLGEITPQAYCIRYALRMVALMGLLLRIYQMIWYPAAKPTSMVLDWWLGKEGIQYFSERDLCIVTRKHVEEDETEIDHLKGVGALNLLALDDLRVLKGRWGLSEVPLSSFFHRAQFKDADRSGADLAESLSRARRR